MSIEQTQQSSDSAYAVYASSPEAWRQPAIDMHAARKSGVLPAGVDGDAVRGAVTDVHEWLPFAAEAYNTSPKLDDYVVVPVTIFMTDLPNTNACAFPFEEMSRWNGRAGRISYATWKGKPTHVEHANKRPDKAHGVIFGSVMRPVAGLVGNLHRVVLLSGWDRTRDESLATHLMSTASGFSMGAWVEEYECSACGSYLRKGGCRHMHPKHGILKQFDGDRLVYRVARGVTGFELSRVASPSWRGAVASAIG